MEKQLFTLCIVHQHPRVLLGMKKRGFGKGKWNGFGGKVQEGESLEEAMRREMREEAGIEVHDVESLGVLEFRFTDKSEVMEAYVFKAKNFSGEPMETEEMAPRWFPIDEIPFSEMWQDDVFWFPLFMQDRRFHGSFTFDEKDNLLHYSLGEVDER
jgi:8-oxo-dGTP diphosphatase/2-hydroxy-dATP diphosphatase